MNPHRYDHWTAREDCRRPWERLQDLFSRAVDLPESEREAFITGETGDDKLISSKEVK